MNKQIRFICAQPAIDYYTWQVEVMINNFIENGINPNHIDIVCWKKDGIIPENWSKLAEHYNMVRFFFYNDTRETKDYTSSIRPNILKQHWLAHPELIDDVIFYHDNDIVFTKAINWSKFIYDDNWYGSDTRFYISHDYIISKGNDILNKMCRIVGIDKAIVKNNELNSIGAQYIMKNVDYSFWNNVEKDSERLFKEITKENTKKLNKDPKYHPVQIWCADMWAVLWNAWKLNINTICDDDLQFSWGTSNIADWNRFNIFHNAGVVNNKDGLFYKADYMNKLPYGENLEIKDNTSSYKYWEIIKRVGEKSCLT